MEGGGVSSSSAVFWQHSLTHRKHIKVSIEASLDAVRSLRKMEWIQNPVDKILGVEPSLMPSVAAAISSSFFSAFTRCQLGKSQDVVLAPNNPG
jgi:hypothetical protein